MNSYSFRSECLHDVLNFLAVVGERSRISACGFRQDDIFPDVEVELVVGMSLVELRKVANEITDLHVINESLERK